MIPIQIKIKNFLCFRDVPAVSFEGIHVACLCGENGAGKSSVFDAITYALWGETSRGRGDDLIHSGQNDMSVELEFLSGTNRYLIIRKQTRGSVTRSGKSVLDIQVFDGTEYKPLSEALKKETQAQINSLLHLDYDTFINSAMILQGRANEFSKKRPGERKEILANILDLSFYDQLEQQARDLAGKNKIDAAILERDLLDLQGKLGDRGQLRGAQGEAATALKSTAHEKEVAEATVEDLRQRRGALSAKKEQVDLLAEQITTRQRKLEGLQKNFTEARANIERLNKVIAGGSEIEAGYAACQEQLEGHNIALSQVKADIQSLNVVNNELSSTINDLKDKIEMLTGTGAACPLCESELGADGCAKLRDKLAGELNAKAGQQSETNAKIGESKTLGSHLEKVIGTSAAALKKIEASRSEVAAATVRLENEEAGRFDLLEDIQALGKEITDLSVKYTAIKNDLSGLPEITAQLAPAEQRLAALNNSERELRDRLAALAVKLQQVDEYATEITTKAAALCLCKEDESLYSELARYFGKRGIQALIIEETLPEIEAEANLLLSKMTDGRMALTIETQKDTKKGSTVETLEVKIADELGMRPYEMFSGGEAYRIDLALRIAISRLLVRRAGAAMPILIIDEGFGTQDSAGIEKLVEAISSIQDDFEKVFVITHLDELKDRFPSIISVVKTTDGSVISIGGN
jgi:DNA repair protein SbcC/Rad50